MTTSDLLEPRVQEAKVPATEAPVMGMMQIIERAARDPSFDVQKLDALLAMQERLEKRQAEREFIAAFARLSGDLPRVKKNGTISLGNDKQGKPMAVAFAKWEDMDKVIRPLMAREGFTLSFDSASRVGEGGGLVVTGTLMHKDGHSRTASMPLALDTGPGRNNLQAMGSTLSYGKRYCTEMLLNIVREGQDDDGATGEDIAMISDEQKERLIDLIKATNSDTAKFLKAVFPRAKYGSLDEIPASRYPDAEAKLIEKKTKMEARP